MKTISHIKYFELSIIIFSILFISHCTQEKDESEYGIFDIYLIQDSEQWPSGIDEVPIEEIELPERPVATLEDIDTYKILQSNSGRSLVHSIMFKSEMKEHFGYNNCWFVLVVDGIRTYQGEYWANFMSTYPSSVIIYTLTDSEFHIMAHDEGVDIINNPRIINILIDSGVDVVYVNTGTP